MDLSSLTFHDSPHAPNARRVRIFLAEKNIKLKTVQVDLGALEHRGPAFGLVNPFREVPALELGDGMVLTESIAICRYLESLCPEPNLFGRNAREAAEIEMWQRRIELGWMFPTALAFRHSHPGMAKLEDPQVAEVAEFGRRKTIAWLQVLEKALEGRTFVARDTFSIADITGMVCFGFMRMARINLPERMHNLAAWRDRLMSRPSHDA